MPASDLDAVCTEYDLAGRSRARVLKVRQRGAEPPGNSAFWTAVPLFAGFIFVGAADVLLGVLLPRIALLHHLNDDRSGLLLMVEFATCATGGLIVRKRLAHAVTGGYALISAGVVAAAMLPDRVAFLGIGGAGLGLGMAMTATNLLICRVFPRSRGAALSILNFVWSIGATLCPVLIARLPAGLSPLSICWFLAAICAICAVFVSPGAFHAWHVAPAQEMSGERAAVRTVVVAAAVAFLYVGAEATLGSWMSTFACRSASWGPIKSGIAAAWFWGALLLGRGIAPLILQVVSESKVHLVSIFGAGAGVLVIVSAQSPVQLLVGAGIAGLMLAPVFPLNISLFMRRAPNSRDAGLVFGLAGFGGAIFPWLAGEVSSATHSLRGGLLVAMIAIAGMLWLTLVALNERREPDHGRQRS